MRVVRRFNDEGEWPLKEAWCNTWERLKMWGVYKKFYRPLMFHTTF